jgi:hypothetical protein
VRPDAFLQRTLPVAEIFFTRTFAFIALFVFLIDMFLVLRECTRSRSPSSIFSA